MSAPLPADTIVVCGEALIDLVPGEHSGSWHSVFGGGPANTAIALRRLGTPAALLCRLSQDSFGRQLRAHLTASDVDLSRAVSASQPTTLAVVSLDTEGVAGYDFYGSGSADWQWSADELPSTMPAQVAGLHVGSLATVMPPGDGVLRDWVGSRARTVPVTYDVNVRPDVLPDRAAYRRRVEAWLAVANEVKASEDDLRWLYPDEDPRHVALRWAREYAVEVVLVTQGAAGAYALSPTGEQWNAPAPRLPVVDTVGAGDTFTAAYLHFMLTRGRGDMPGALRYATFAAAITCTRRGAQPPVADEVDALLGDVGAGERQHG